MAVGDRLDLLRHPVVVGLDQAELAEVVVAMGVEAGRDEDHLRAERLEARHPVRLDQLAHRRPARVRRDRQVDHVGALRHAAAVRVERVLEDADHQHALVVRDDVLGAVAVVDVEVDDRDALEPAHVERMARGDRDVVEEAEAHRRRRVAWWPGGRTEQNAFSTVPSMTASVAATAAPAARITACRLPGLAIVSGSSAHG
jgi:hypothetical protein